MFSVKTPFSFYPATLYTHSAMKNTEHRINLSVTIPEELAGKRLDQALAIFFPDYSRARLQDWIQKELIKVNGEVKRPRYIIEGGEQVTITASLPIENDWQPQAIELDIIYEDDALIVINKPVGLVVHPAPGNRDSTLVNALLHHEPNLARLPRAGIIHRLDKDTSGLLVIAKTLGAHTELVRQLQARTIEREYYALVNGIVISGGTINLAIGRHPKLRKQMTVLENGKHAVTHYRVIEKFQAHTLLKVNLETGRTHQIRVHFAHLHHAIVGDQTYGGRLKLPKNAEEELKNALRQFKRQALHAKRLALVHPTTKQPIEWHADLPKDFQQLLEVLRKDFLP